MRRGQHLGQTILVTITTALLWAGPVAAQSAEAWPPSILSELDKSGGVAVHVGRGDGSKTARLCQDPRWVVHGLDSGSEKVAKARVTLNAPPERAQVSVMHWDRPYLPYRDGIVNLLVCEEVGPEEEIIRVLVPGGRTFVRANGRWKTLIKPRPP